MCEAKSLQNIVEEVRHAGVSAFNAAVDDGGKKDLRRKERADIYHAAIKS